MSTTATHAPATAALADRAGWLRGPAFDGNLIGTVCVLAVAAGIAGMFDPNLFSLVLLLDLWLLGYHHVVSTFTRLTFDSDSFKQHRFLVIQLPILVIVGTLAAVLSLGYWVLPTTYLYWQWFHYTRQSYGIERAYRRKAGEHVAINDYLTTRSLYLLPLFGILHRSYQQQSEFLGMEVKYLPVTLPLLWIVGVLSVVAMAAWMAQQLVALFQNRLALAHTLYVLSHHIVFLTGYLLIDDITTGWLVLNVWHNAQYILFVWMFNNNRFKKGVDERHWFLSTISQTKNMIAYFGICLLISTVVHFVLKAAGDGAMAATAIPVTLVLFMMINFHHYLVDGIIWKVRKPALQKNLGIPA